MQQDRRTDHAMWRAQQQHCIKQQRACDVAKSNMQQQTTS